MAVGPVPFNDPVASRVLRLYRDAITKMCDDALRGRPYSMLIALQYRDGLSE